MFTAFILAIYCSPWAALFSASNLSPGFLLPLLTLYFRPCTFFVLGLSLFLLLCGIQLQTFFRNLSSAIRLIWLYLLSVVLSIDLSTFLRFLVYYISCFAVQQCRSAAASPKSVFYNSYSVFELLIWGPYFWPILW